MANEEIHSLGRGSYSDTRQIGHVMEATIQLDAGFCWNGKTVRWVWGLNRGDCNPISTAFTQVHMTCRIAGGGRAPITVRYEAQVSSAVFPFVTRNETLDLIVTPQGYRLQIPLSAKLGSPRCYTPATCTSSLPPISQRPS